MRQVAIVLVVSCVFLTTACNPFLCTIFHPASVRSGEIFDLAISFSTSGSPNADVGVALQLPIGFEIISVANQPSVIADPGLDAQFVAEPGHYVTTIYSSNGLREGAAMLRAGSTIGAANIKVIMFDILPPAVPSGPLVASITSPFLVSDFSQVGGAHSIWINVLPATEPIEGEWDVEAIPFSFTLLKVADLNSDGIDEILGLTALDELVTLFQSPAGMWSFLTSNFNVVGSDEDRDTLITVVEDFDGDGHMDVVAANMNSDLVYYPSLGNGTFGTGVVIAPFGADPRRIQTILAYDDEGDGDLDLIVAPTMNQPFVVFRNDGQGVFVEDLLGLVPLNNTLYTIGFAEDLDGDGREEVIGSDGSGWSAVTRTAAGQFALLGSLPLNGGAPKGWSDFDNDGLPDLVVAIQATLLSPFSAAIEIHRNTSTVGALSFAPPIVIANTTGALLVNIGNFSFEDFNDDGFRDLMVPGIASWRGGPGMAFVAEPFWHQQLDPFFGFSQAPQPSNLVPTVLGFADLRGDGDRKMILGTIYGRLARIMRLRRSNLGPCGDGTVAQSTGTRESCLLLNGSAGEGDGRVSLAIGNPISLDVLVPSPNGPGLATHFAIWGKEGLASNADQFPTGIGTFCVPVAPFVTGSEYFIITNSNNHAAGFFPSSPAPWSLSLPQGLSIAADLVITGVIRDDSAPSGYSVLNTLQVEVR